MAGVGSNISEEGLDPLKQVESLSILISGADISEVGLIRG
jgi:hypothetical protein